MSRPSYRSGTGDVPLLGETIGAFLYAHPAIEDFSVIGDKVPRYVLFVESFPMTVSGKVQTYKMREISTEKLGLQRASEIVTA